MKILSKSGTWFLIIGYVIIILLNIWLWPYSINTWLTFFGKAPIFPWWGGIVLATVPFFGYLAIPIALITWVLSMFL